MNFNNQRILNNDHVITIIRRRSTCNKNPNKIVLKLLSNVNYHISILNSIILVRNIILNIMYLI
jgi:hypothetical protein